MLYAQCLPPNALRICGFENTRTARDTFYRRAKVRQHDLGSKQVLTVNIQLLFDFDIEPNSLAKAQAALLLSYYTTNSHPRTNTHWLNVAIHNAKASRAHLYNKDENVGRMHQVKKRLWWCCILRDRVLPLGVRRPIQITHDHFDFNNHAFTDEDMEDEMYWSRVHSPQIKKVLAKVIAAQCDLAILLTDVLTLLYPLDGSLPTSPESTLEWNKVQAKICEHTTELMKWNEKFSMWKSALPSSLGSHDLVEFHVSLIELYYW